MRRKDLITLALLGGIAWYSWQKLQPPKIDDHDLTLNEAILSSLSKWTGSIQAAKAQDLNDATAVVKGASTDNQVTPQSLLPVESYSGSPFVYSLSAMLKENNLTVYPEDIIEAFPNPSLGIGSTIKIYRATPIQVTDWGKTTTYRSWQKTVGDFLTEAHLELGDNDRVSPDETKDLSIQNGQAVIVITRVAITEVKVKEKIDFKRIEKEDPDLPRGQTKIDKGSAGERTKTFRVTRENGIEVKRELLTNEVTKQPKDETVIKGTKVVIGKTYTGRASWYKYNSTKVASDLFKRGTQLRITNLDNGKVIFVTNDGCICADTGYVVDLHPDHFTALGGKISDGVMKHIKVDEVLN